MGVLSIILNNIWYSFLDTFISSPTWRHRHDRSLEKQFHRQKMEQRDTEKLREYFGPLMAFMVYIVFPGLMLYFGCFGFFIKLIILLVIVDKLNTIIPSPC